MKVSEVVGQRLPLLCWIGMKAATGNTGTDIWAGGRNTAGYIKIAVYGFALSALWSGLHSIILPLRLLDFVAESEKNTALGLLTFAGLVLAMAVQPVAGAISDRSGFRWGRRRPYILMGTIIALLFLPGIGLAQSFLAIFLAYCLLQLSANLAQGSYQAFIPDIVPEGKRGRASGVKSLLEILGGVTLLYPIAFFMDQYSVGQGVSWLWLALGVLAAVMLGALTLTLLMVKERPGTGSRSPLLPALYKSFKIDFRANRDFVWFLISRMLILMAFTTLQSFALYFLRDVVAVANPALASARFSIVAVLCMLAVVYPAGRLSDRVGRRPIAVSSALIGAVGIALIFLFRHDYLIIMFGGGLVGLSFGAFMSTNWALATDLVAKGEEARYLGLTNLATAGGAALARLIGPVIDFFNGYESGLGYLVMLLACFVYLLTGAALLMKIRGRQPK